MSHTYSILMCVRLDMVNAFSLFGGNSLLTNREIATLIIFGLAFVFVVFKLGLRQVTDSILDIVKALHWKVLLTIGLYAIYAIGAVWAAAAIGLWEPELLKDTVIWAVFSGLPVLFRAHTVKDGQLLVKRTLAETFGVSVFIVFYVNLHSFSIVWEVVLQLALTILAELVVRHQGEKTRPVANGTNFLITAIAILMIWTTTSWFIDNWGTVDHSLLRMSLAMALWFPLVLLPLIYVVAFAMHCESTLTMLKFFNDRKRPKLGVRLGYLLGTHGGARFASGVTGKWRIRLGEATGFRQATAVMAAYRQAVRDEEEAERRALQRLKDYAGVKGVDDHGRQLDRREFDETQDALEYLWNCMLGHARNRKGKHRRDLLEIVDDFSRHGLPAGADHGITLEVTKDRSAWYAWRRTVTGWVFAVGGNRRNAAIQWIYDGAEPPTEFPSAKNGTWCDSITGSAAASNWGTGPDAQDAVQALTPSG